MQIIDGLDRLRTATRSLRAAGRRIALVPTMGALHAGHMKLVERGFQLADAVVVSIFVNPAQFGPGEDFASYPRSFEADAAMLGTAGVAILWAPQPDKVYPPGFATSVRVAGLADPLCGAHRPGHFDGVALVVAKLFNQVQPDVALFGEKDWQQLAIIRRMAADLDFAVDVVAVPTERAADGLALSSRNAYLDDAQRARAAALPRALDRAVARLAAGEAAEPVLAAACDELTKAGFGVEYLELRGGDDLKERSVAEPGDRLFVAARLGSTRLIDNRAVFECSAR